MARREIPNIDIVEVNGRKSRALLREQFLKELINLRDKRGNEVSFFHVLTGAFFNKNKNIMMKVI